eukprot:1141576-Pelagomonas_calceolata.AAC.1
MGQGRASKMHCMHGQMGQRHQLIVHLGVSFLIRCSPACTPLFKATCVVSAFTESCKESLPCTPCCRQWMVHVLQPLNEKASGRPAQHAG